MRESRAGSAAIVTRLKEHLKQLVFEGGKGSTAHFLHQGRGTPLASDLDQEAGEEAKARQVEPGGMEELWSEGSIFATRKNLGSIGQKPLTSRCRPDVKKQRFIVVSKLITFTFRPAVVFFVCVLMFKPQCLIRIRMN